MGAAFLGTCYIMINYRVNASRTAVTINYKVTNSTGWESGTRYLPDGPDKDKAHDSIIPDKPRGQNIHLGGNIYQTWEWQEVLPIN